MSIIQMVDSIFCGLKYYLCYFRQKVWRIQMIDEDKPPLIIKWLCKLVQNLIINFSIIKRQKISTMKIPRQGRTRAGKKSKPQHNKHLQQQINSDDILSEPEEYNPKSNGNHYQQEDHRTPQQVKIALAKKLIQKTKASLSKKKEQGKKERDQFFIEEGGDKKTEVQDQDDQLGEQLKNQYLRSKNKLYTDNHSYFKTLSIQPVASYKGHTKCITAIACTGEQIFSVSKDRSIITWDRETGKKDFITMAKQQTSTVDHEGPILCMDYHPVYQMIVTAGQDGKIKLWDVRTNSLIQTLKGHRNTVNGVKFGIGGNNLCSVSADRSMKQWDCAQRGIIQTYYGHNAEVLDIDYINANDFISSGNDHQNIVWKTQKQTQMIFQGHDYAIDRVRSINEQKFISASQDGGINLWSQRKKKPIFKQAKAHQSWICALDCIKQSNIFASGDCDKILKIWSIGAQLKSFQKLHQIHTKGMITDIKISQKQIVAASSQEHRLGRWLTTRVRNQIQAFKFTQQ